MKSLFAGVLFGLVLVGCPVAKATNLSENNSRAGEIILKEGRDIMFQDFRQPIRNNTLHANKSFVYNNTSRAAVEYPFHWSTSSGAEDVCTSIFKARTTPSYDCYHNAD